MDALVEWSLNLDWPGWIKWPVVCACLIVYGAVFLGLIAIYCYLQYLFWSAWF